MTEQLFQIGVKGLIRDDKGDVLLVHISAFKEYPAMWDLPGGRMEPGETFLQTLARELQEEIGMTYIGTPRQVMAVPANLGVLVEDIHYPLSLIVYEVEIAADVPIQLDSNSSEDDYAWVRPREAADMLSEKFSSELCDYVRQLV